MQQLRPIVLSIAGFDPSGGAGVLADVKTFEQHHVYGLSVITANTCQTEHDFYHLQWTEISFVEESIIALAKVYNIKAVKIGIVPSIPYLLSILYALRHYIPKAFIIWDTVMKSSTGFTFTTTECNDFSLQKALSMLDLITPNYNEIFSFGKEGSDAQSIARSISDSCNVLLKGGHNEAAVGVDYLFAGNLKQDILPSTEHVIPKHGSGCVLSAAIAANIALGKGLSDACIDAKKYTEQFLNSNYTLSGYHVQ